MNPEYSNNNRITESRKLSLECMARTISVSVKFSLTSSGADTASQMLLNFSRDYSKAHTFASSDGPGKRYLLCQLHWILCINRIYSPQHSFIKRNWCGLLPKRFFTGISRKSRVITQSLPGFKICRYSQIYLECEPIPAVGCFAGTRTVLGGIICF
jgi:hypothetical protein